MADPLVQTPPPSLSGPLLLATEDLARAMNSLTRQWY